MSNTIKVQINATDNGSIDGLTKKTKELNKELKQAQRSAGQTAAVQQSSSSFEYRQTRSARGTGAEGRDFARQAQGLGGLVRVYATYAANIFALTAAFSALSRAADFTNMVAGLEQLGAAAGKNLNYAAKSMTSLTDGAISLKEAMTSVANASAAGLSTSQIEKLTIVAKKSSIALGRDMSDSITRLTRGIAKMEPELLDELGIFVRVDSAAKKYAESIGKTTSSLTDFERRQAFANAALDQGIKKFDQIKADSNPFSKLQASITNLLYDVGGMVTKVLGPLVDILSSSPTALLGALGMLVAKIGQSALPAIGAWRAELVQAAEDSSRTAIAMSKAAEEYSASMNAKKYLGQREGMLKLATDNDLFKGGSATLANLAKDDTKALEKAYAEVSKKISMTRGEINKLSTDSSADAVKQKADLSNRIELYEKLQRQIRATQVTLQKDDVKTPREIALDRKADTANQQAARNAMMASFASTASLVGISAAMEELRDGVKTYNDGLDESNKKISKTRTLFMGIHGAAAAVLGTIASFVSRIFTVVAVIGGIISLFQMLRSAISSSAKEQEAFASAMERSEAAADAYKNTAIYLKTLGFEARNSTDAILANATAIKESSDALKNAYAEYKKLKDTQNAPDRFFDRLQGEAPAKGPVISGSTLTLAKNMSSSIIDIYKGLASNPELQKEYYKSIESILGTKPILTSQEKFIKQVKISSSEQFEELSKVADKFATKNNNSINNVNSALDKLKEASKKYDSIVSKYANSDPQNTMYLEVFQGFADLSNNIDTAANSLAAFQSLADNTSLLKLMPPGIAEEIARASIEIKNYAKIMDDSNNPNKAMAEKLINEKVASILPKGLAAAAASAAKSFSVSAARTIKEASISALQTLAARLKGVGGVEVRASLTMQQINLSIEKIKSDTRLITSQEALRLTLERIHLEERRREAEEKLSIERSMASRGEFKGGVALSESAKRIASNENNLVVISKGLEQITIDMKNLGLLESGSVPGAKLLAESPSLGAAAAALSSANAQISSLRIQKLSAAEMFDLEELETTEAKRRSAKEVERARLAKNKVLNSPNLVDLDERVIATQRIEDLKEEQEAASAERTARTEAIGALEAKEKAIWESKKGVSTDVRAKAIKDIIDESNAQRKSLQVETENEIIAKEKEIVEIRKAASTARVSEYQNIAKNVSMILDYEESSLEIARNSGKLSESEYITEAGKLEIQKNYLKYYDDLIAKNYEIRDLTSTIAQVNLEIKRLSDSNVEDDKDKVIQLKKQKDLLEKGVDLRLREEKILQANRKYEEAMIQARVDYEKGVLAVEKRLLDIETGTFGTLKNASEYAKLGIQDFANKLHDAVKDMKSAMSVLNDGIISAVDGTIDKFYEAINLGDGKLGPVWKSMREDFTRAFSNMAAQNVKNLWKKGLGSIFESTEQKEAKIRAEKEAKAKAEYLRVTESLGISITNAAPTMQNLADSLNRFIGAIPQGDGSKTGPAKVDLGTVPNYSLAPKGSILDPLPDFRTYGMGEKADYSLLKGKTIKEDPSLSVHSESNSTFDEQKYQVEKLKALQASANINIADELRADAIDREVIAAELAARERSNFLKKMPDGSEDSMPNSQNWLSTDTFKSIDENIKKLLRQGATPPLDGSGIILDQYVSMGAFSNYADEVNEEFNTNNNLERPSLGFGGKGLGTGLDLLSIDTNDMMMTLNSKTTELTNQLGGALEKTGYNVNKALQGINIDDLFRDPMGTALKAFSSVILDVLKDASSSMGGSTGGGGFLSNVGSFVSSFFAAAKGGVFDGSRGLSAYSGSIVSSPTQFAFARGGVPNMGLMGEAGPEAIIPLKRDDQGNLGIRGGGQPNVSVNVHNYGKEKATTKETTDSRGNRSIEVVIGDMVASQMATPGSAVNNTINSSRNQTVRR